MINKISNLFQRVVHFFEDILEFFHPESFFEGGEQKKSDKQNNDWKGMV
jgi:hypothetical protein